MRIFSRIIVWLTVVLLSFAVTSAFAAVPSPLVNVTASTDTTLNTLTWNVTNLTDDTSGFKLIRIDWLYPIYDVNNIAPGAPWTFRTYQLAPDDVSGGIAENAVSWATSVSNGLANGASMSYTIHSTPLVTLQDPYPIHITWARLRADTPNGEPTTIDVGVVPEPSSLLALICGIGGIGSLAFRKRTG